jgi:hypothetical protein
MTRGRISSDTVGDASNLCASRREFRDVLGKAGQIRMCWQVNIMTPELTYAYQTSYMKPTVWPVGRPEPAVVAEN